MSDPSVDRWRQTGRVFLWRDPDQTRNYPGWNCTADAEGCDSLSELLTLMAVAQWTATANILLSTPTEAIASLPGPYRGRRRLSPGRLRLVYRPGKVAENYWRWSDHAQTSTLAVGKSKLDDLRRAFGLVAAGQGDFCIHADDLALHGLDLERMAIWFW